ncbi:MAG: polymer-forming cytoskeletal protein [Ferruginibacter sp.]|nr:polymer-forming cytoskeletal protein [Ferruginibacter sp.]
MKNIRTLLRFYFRKQKSSYQINTTSLISSGNEISGDIKTNDNIRIDGVLKGNLICTAKFVLGPNGAIEGNVKAFTADIQGKIDGMVVVEDLLYLRDKAYICGDISASKLMIEPSAHFNGHCKMGTLVMELSADLALAAHG